MIVKIGNADITSLSSKLQSFWSMNWFTLCLFFVSSRATSDMVTGRFLSVI